MKNNEAIEGLCIGKGGLPTKFVSLADGTTVIHDDVQFGGVGFIRNTANGVEVDDIPSHSNNYSYNPTHRKH